MLFKDRLEIWNPGNLPFGLTPELLRQPHGSFPTNPLLADPMYLAGYIERMGTGTGDIIKLCKAAGLKEPEFVQEEIFKIIIWRKQTVGQVTDHDTDHDTGQATGQATGQVNEYIRRIVLVILGEVRRSEIQNALGLRHRETFINNYLNPSLDAGFVEMMYPDNPTHPNQRYRLTPKGMELKIKLNAKGEIL